MSYNLYRSPGGRYYSFRTDVQQYVEVHVTSEEDITSNSSVQYVEEDAFANHPQAKVVQQQSKDSAQSAEPSDVTCGTIDVKERHSETKAKNWTRIHGEMVAFVKQLDASIDATAIKPVVLKNTWDKIRETYVRYKNECETSSGSATKDVDPPIHVDIMRNYDTVLVRRKPVTSLEFNEFESYKSPQSSHKRKNKEDVDGLTPFLKTATTFLERMADGDPIPNDRDSAKQIRLDQSGTQLPSAVDTQDKVALFVNSLVPDLRQFDEKHFAMVKMIISKGVYDCIVKQEETLTQY